MFSPPFNLVLHALTAALALLTATKAQSQDDQAEDPARIEILGADKWTFDEKLAPGAQRLIGNARFRHAGAVMNCDSAYIHDDQSVQAFGHVHIRQGDTLHISGDRLDYIGKEHLATITGNVRLSDRDMDLTTEYLIYDLRARTATYTGGGTIVSRKEGNTLTSGSGSYLAGLHQFRFRDDVQLQHPERTITSDTLHYTTTSGLAEFFGPTTITSNDVRMWCTRGSYDTRHDLARFTRRAKVLSNGQELHGDSLHYDRTAGLGRAWGHVLLLDTANGLQVRGAEGRHDENRDLSWVTGQAELVMKLGEDSLYLHGDTLFANADSSGRRIVARRGVRFFKSDMQGACDTMIYADADSVIQLRSSPVLWSGDDQITGHDIRIALHNGQAHRLLVDKDAFIISRRDSLHFDQVTGTTMTGSFDQGELRQLIAEGNCRTVYFPMNEPDSMIIGMNRVDCSRIRVMVRDGEADEIAFLTKPDGTMHPLDKTPPEEMRLRGFGWREEERPVDRQAIFQ